MAWGFESLVGHYSLQFATMETMSNQQSITFTDEQIDEMVKLYEAGKSLREIGREYHCHRTTVKRYLLNMGVQLRPKGGINKERIPHEELERIRFMAIYEKLPNFMIAHRTGLSMSQVQRRLRLVGFRRTPAESGRHGRLRRRLEERGVEINARK
jgi:hypothetical protein